ncbi:hypothetical protein BDZ89DRAFT_115764 [Hymenopellis radicata]|nr:hypothetical protein BDZ89DRAFT_115764 [Hymenopellis radicata]
MPPKKRVKADDEKENAPIVGGSRAMGNRKFKLKNISGLVDLPLDICFEIFSLLSPLDLLQLSRSTKLFRQTLMSRASVTVWQHAREQFHPDLPAPGDIMSEPAWTQLLFENRCHVCTTTIRRAIDWDLGIRLCPQCLPEALIAVRDVVPPEDGSLASLVFSSYPETHTPETRKKFTGKRVVYRAHFEKVSKHYNSLPTKEAKYDYACQCEGRCNDWEDLATKGREWVSRQTQSHEAELEAIKTQRKVEIFDRLRHEGFDDEFDDDICIEELEDHWFVKQLRPLTSKTWSNHRDMMVVFMNGLRAQRLKRESDELTLNRRDEVSDFMRSLKSFGQGLQYTSYPEGWNGKGLLLNVSPGPMEWFSFPRARAIVDCMEEEVPEPLWDALIYRACTDMFEWSTTLHERLFVIHEAATPNIRSIRFLSLASHACVCEECTLPLFYPDVLFHPCLTSRPLYDGTKVPRVKRLGPRNETAVSWDCTNAEDGVQNSVRVDLQLNRLIRSVVKLVGLDPKTATVRDMDNLEVYIQYIDCPYKHEPPGKVPIYDHFAQYIARLKHVIPVSKSMKPRKYLFGWRKFVTLLQQNGFKGKLEKGKNVEVVRANSLRGRPLAEVEDPEGWLCVRCRDTIYERVPCDLDDMRRHLSAIHDIPQANQREKFDYYQNPGQASKIAGTSLIVHDTG